MKIENLSTGVDFENYIAEKFREQGYQVSETPISNDYGADLIIEYNNFKAIIQCKYYSNTVGIKAVQEAVTAKPFYNCSIAIVVTNSTFTQQAKNIADANDVILIDGDSLQSGSYENILDIMKSLGNESPKNITMTQDLLMEDLIIRYGLSKSTILKNFLSRGLPYRKVGREYRFNLNEIEEWERNTGYIGKYKLPAYIEPEPPEPSLACKIYGNLLVYSFIGSIAFFIIYWMYQMVISVTSLYL